ncbi:MAG: nuclear transport factor 2 family protein [Ferruginibacter sp.]
MKKYILLAAFFFFSIIHINAQVELTPDQEAVQRTVIAVFDALSNRDTLKIQSLCTKDIVIVENGIFWNMDTLTQKIVQITAPDFKRINSIDFFDTKVTGNTAWTTYNNQALITKNGNQGSVKWVETTILVKEDNTWKLKVLHSTLVKRS